MKHVTPERVILPLILLLAALLRGWGLGYDLPYIYHPDEPIYLAIIQRIFVTGDLNPHFFNYPSLFFYLNALAYVPFLLLGKLAGVLHSRADILGSVTLAMGVTQAQMPNDVLLGRIVTLIFGVGTVAVVFLAGKRLSGRAAVGLLAALAIAVSPANVANSRMITPDTFVTFFVAAALLGSVLVYQQGKAWQYIVAGLCVGFAASSKYNGGLVVLPLLLAHLYRHGRGALRQPSLYLALFAAAAGFLSTTPFAVIDAPKFLTDLRFETQHYATGHAGMEGDSLAWYLGYAWKTAGLLYLLAVLGVGSGLRSHPKLTGLLAVFAVGYFALICSVTVRNERTFLPLTPALFLLSTWFLVDMFDYAREEVPTRLRGLALWALVGLAAAALAQPLVRTVSDSIRLVTPDSRHTARVWIAANLPPGSRVAIESYSPFVDPSRYAVQGVVRLIDHDADWYLGQGFDYLIASEGMYGRYYLESQKYAPEISQYDHLFRRFAVAKEFDDEGYGVRVLKVR